MPITGRLLIGGGEVFGADAPFQAIDPATGERLPTAFHGADTDQVARACILAGEAFDEFRAIGPAQRARLLDAIAEGIEALGDELIDRAVSETGLPQARLVGERGRTVGQLRLFAEVARRGWWQDVRIDHADPSRAPAPKPDLRQRHIAIGPVALFGASNFPLAFSVAGGDTAAALAAGCPVVAKAHPAHPGVSELVGRVIQAAVRELDLPEGVFSLVQGQGAAVGQALARDPHIKAIGFTGSRSGGLALMATAAARPEPIPVFAEMSSINPVVLLPGALAERGAEIAAGYVASLNLGAGQFCTNPGLVVLIEGEGAEPFLQAAADAVATATPQTMLSPGIHGAFVTGLDALSGRVEALAQGPVGGLHQSQAAIFTVAASQFANDPGLAHEVFGPASVIVRCADVAEARAVLEGLEGQLTATVQMSDADLAAARTLLPTLERKVGRILVNGFPTGVEVSHAMVHGGPYPATSDGRSTSVGTLAIRRFLRPVCYQDFPAGLLPPELVETPASGQLRLVDGVPELT